MDTALRRLLQDNTPSLAAAVGSGLTAQAAEEGNIDFLMILSAGHFRVQGCGSAAALLPYSNANRLAFELAERHVLPRVRRVPTILGLCAQDPSLDFEAAFREVRRLGVTGVTNFPSVGFIDGQYREALEESGLGYGKEVDLLRAAAAGGLFTIAFVFDAGQAVKMATAGVDILCADLGFASTRGVAEKEHAAELDAAILHVNRLIAAVGAVRPDPYVVVFGGPVLTPRDAAVLRQHTRLRGYVGGSTIERFPAARYITHTVREFREAIAPPDPDATRRGALIGRSPAIRRVYALLERVADTDAPVLLLGETGTGKELAARELHRLGRRRTRPMVSWNCGALAESLAMSELFGHEKGAFTGALARHPGKFEQANGGTLFMDEVADLPLVIQSSLLRTLQEGEIVRVGGREPIGVDVRLVAATNKDIAVLVRDGQFRLDLFYRLNTVVVRMPSLRERPEDIPLLVRELTREFCRRYDYPVPPFPEAVMEAFSRHRWPGNVRELRNAVERCVILGRGELFRVEWLEDLFDLAETIAREPAAPSVAATNFASRAGQRALLPAALEKHGGNVSAVARELGVSRKTIYAWLREEGVVRAG